MNCSLLYAATDRPLPEVRSELFSVERVLPTDGKYTRLHQLCGASNIYHLASHSGCGCGWGFRGNDTEWDLLNLGSVDQLAAYLRRQIAAGDIALLSSRSEQSDRSFDGRARLSLDVFLSQFQMWRVQASAAHVSLVELTR